MPFRASALTSPIKMATLPRCQNDFRALSGAVADTEVYGVDELPLAPNRCQRHGSESQPDQEGNRGMPVFPLTPQTVPIVRLHCPVGRRLIGRKDPSEEYHENSL